MYKIKQNKETKMNAFLKIITLGFYSKKPTNKAKQEPLVIDTKKLYIGNLSYKAKEHDVKQLFDKAGTVKSVNIAINKYNNKSRGFGFVEMSTIDEAQKAAKKFCGSALMGRKMVINGAKSKKS